jgi:hypothetical protein
MGHLTEGGETGPTIDPVRQDVDALILCQILCQNLRKTRKNRRLHPYPVPSAPRS